MRTIFLTFWFQQIIIFFRKVYQNDQQGDVQIQVERPILLEWQQTTFELEQIQFSAPAQYFQWTFWETQLDFPWWDCIFNIRHSWADSTYCTLATLSSKIWNFPGLYEPKKGNTLWHEARVSVEMTNGRRGSEANPGGHTYHWALLPSLGGREMPKP